AATPTFSRSSWRSKNYAFEFVECINSVVQTEMISSIRNARVHTLIVDESTDISVHKMLVLYIKFREQTDFSYKTVFAGIIQLSGCTAENILDAITKFYADHALDMNKMVMFTSDGASVMLGRHKGVAALLKRQVPHLTEQHCVAHREDLGIDDAWKDVPIMKEVETLLRTVYSMFCRSSVKKAKFTEMAEVLEVDSLSFRPLNEVRWLSRYQAVHAFLRNFSALTEYCAKDADSDPIAKYCHRKLTDTKYKFAITVLAEVLEELAQLCTCLQRSNLTVMDGHCIARAKIQKLRAQYLGERVHWGKRALAVLESESAVNTRDILLFVHKVCEHLDARFPENELKEWAAFEPDTLDHAVGEFDHGLNDVTSLAKKFEALMHEADDSVPGRICQQYNEFKFMVNEKRKIGLLRSFSEIVTWSLKSEHFPDLAQLLDICGTFQASSADCERGFSLMNAIKTKSRNRLEVFHLDQLMRIKLRQKEGPIDLDKVYNHWKGDKDRREKI
uniref:HAT C-terminal dimerisation domain-containing protein n=1 Tax=Cyprinus carpio TaxID=7962 RepID=A0A8C1MMI3_CYPCA